LNKFFLNKTNIEELIKNICFISDEIREEKPKKDVVSKNNNIINNGDELFWYWYIFQFGFSNYEMLGKNVYKKEMEMKTSLVEKIHKQKKELKKLKFKIPDIEQDILYSKKISIKSFMVLLFMHNINLFFYTDVYYYTTDNPFDKTMIIYYNNDSQIYELKDNINIDVIKKEKYNIESLDKKIRAISSYKADNIKEIAKKLNIGILKSSGKSYTKKELYEKIVQKLS
jgi:hypothetical protein